jgi:gliding motility-associated-like protein
VKPERCEQLDGSLELEFQNNLPTSSVIWTDPVTGGQIDEGTALYDYEAGIYEVTVTTVFGCVTTQQSEIPTEIFEFNGVSPNGDNRNDGFEIACITKFPNNHVKIYNRAGQLVYQAENYDNELTIFKGIGERGIYFTGKELPDGTYFYVIDKGEGSEPVVGYLELFR